MKTLNSIKTSLYHTFIVGDASVSQMAVVFLTFSPVIIFFVVELIKNHISR